MNTPDNTQNPRQQLTRRYHALCRQLGMTADERLALLAAYGVQTSLDLTTRQLQQLVRKLNDTLPDTQQRQKVTNLRRRIYAAVSQYLTETGQQPTPQLIRAVACRAASESRFEDISAGKLAGLVYAFNHKTKIHQAVRQMRREAQAENHSPIHIHSKNI